jgi:hypothetical protein
MQIHKVKYNEYIGYMDFKYYCIINPDWKEWKENDMAWVFENIKTEVLFIWTPVALENIPHKTVRNKFKYCDRITWRKMDDGNEYYSDGEWFKNSTESLMLFAKENIRPFNSTLRNIFTTEASEIKPKKAEVEIIKSLGKGATGAYIFCGKDIKLFVDFTMDCVDVCFSKG